MRRVTFASLTRHQTAAIITIGIGLPTTTDLIKPGAPSWMEKLRRYYLFYLFLLSHGSVYAMDNGMSPESTREQREQQAVRQATMDARLQERT